MPFPREETRRPARLAAVFSRAKRQVLRVSGWLTRLRGHERRGSLPPPSVVIDAGRAKGRMDDLERNKQIVMAFYELMFNQREPAERSRDTRDMFRLDENVMSSTGTCSGSSRRRRRTTA